MSNIVKYNLFDDDKKVELKKKAGKKKSFSDIINNDDFITEDGPNYEMLELNGFAKIKTED